MLRDDTETILDDIQNVQLLELARIPGGDIEFKFVKADDTDIFTYTGDNSAPRPVFTECAFYFNLYIMKE